MILHTIIDVNDIFYEQASPTNSISCKDIGNVHLEGIKSDKGIEIKRIISTNPDDYLKGKYSIGKYIK